VSAVAIARAVGDGRASAAAIVEEALARIAARDAALGAFTAVLAGRARARAAWVDRDGRHLPLAGVPFAVKNLFDVADLATLAGSRINRDRAPAATDATAVRRLEAAGAVLVGALNMGEYAYDFTGENAHHGPSRNPHDLSRMAGGSSGGSGAAVAGGLVPLALGSDTNGSIRVPAAFCGLFGLRPTYRRLSRAGTFPFVSSLDTVGPLARTAADVAVAYEAMQGADPRDPSCAGRAVEPARTGGGIEGIRIGVLGGYFRENAGPEAWAALERVAAALPVADTVELPGAVLIRQAAYVVTAVEGAALHLGRLRARAAEFDPEVRDRLIAGALVPGSLYVAAQRYRRAARERVLALFAHYDALIAPSTPCPAPPLGAKTLRLGREDLPLRASIGLLAQPLSCLGLPVAAVPVAGPGLPLGVQVAAAPWREDVALRVAAFLEEAGIARAAGEDPAWT
jgi:aspartyl-tRNA(Asn)/glutamyl-tRNA(Gln) amidotransferase subunit A